MNIKYNDLKSQYLAIKSKVDQKIEKVILDGSFILGEQVSWFEKDFAYYVGTSYAVGVSNGTDAIKLAAKTLDLSGKIAIYIQANTFISTVLGVLEAYPKADIYLIDIDNTLQINLGLLKKKLENNKNNHTSHLVIPSHMFGWTCDMKALKEICEEYGAIVLEDSSQAHGTIGIDNKKTGSYGAVNAFSLYPGKNLGAFGDAGVITTNDENLYNKLLKLRNLGQVEKYNHEIVGYNNRLDTIQAAVLFEKIKMLDIWNDKRVNIANFYYKNINNPKLQLPTVNSFCLKNSWHAYPIQTDDIDGLKSHLESHNIEYRQHYPIPIEESLAFSHLGFVNQNTREFSKKHIMIPIHPYLIEEEQSYICSILNSF